MSSQRHRLSSSRHTDTHTQTASETKGGSRVGERGGGEVEAPQAPREVGFEEGVPPSPTGEGSGEGTGAEFLSQNGAFLCILQSAALILGSENAWRRGSVGFLS